MTIPGAMGEHLLRPDLEETYPVFVAGDGCELIDDTGRRYLDAASGVGVTCLGYSVAEVVEAMTAQARLLPYVHSLRFETQPMKRLADSIAALAPGDLDHVFFVSGGSEANESAFKFARQYWLERGQPERWRIIGRRPSFHGNTLATLSAGWHAARRRRHAPLLLDFAHTETPNPYRGCSRCRWTGCSASCADGLIEVIEAAGPETVAAYIAEPVVGAAAAALVPPPGYFERIRAICDHYDVLLIADEVITGLGRTGRWFGIEHFGVQPDILTFAKGISGGYAPLGGLVVRGALVDAFRRGSGRFEHNFTMAGHPVACACGLATLDVLQRDNLVERVAEIGPRFLRLLGEEVGHLSFVGDVRGIGLLAGVELVADRQTRRPFPPGRAISRQATRYAMEEGVIVYACSGGVEGDSGDYLLLMPPFISSEDQLAEMVARLRSGLIRLSGDILGKEEEHTTQTAYRDSR